MTTDTIQPLRHAPIARTIPSRFEHALEAMGRDAEHTDIAAMMTFVLNRLHAESQDRAALRRENEDLSTTVRRLDAFVEGLTEARAQQAEEIARLRGRLEELEKPRDLMHGVEPDSYLSDHGINPNRIEFADESLPTASGF